MVRFQLALALPGLLLLAPVATQAQALTEPPGHAPTPNLVPATNRPAAQAPAVVAKPPPKPPVPPAPELDVDRFGKILGPGDQPTYPVKLYPSTVDIGEVKIPNQGDVRKRQKLEQLASMSDDEIRAQLAQWPAFSKMSLADEGAFITRIQQFRERRAKIAQVKIHQLGLLTLTPAQMARFEKDYWDKQLKLNQELVKQFEPIYKARQTQLDQELFSEFSSSALPPATPKSPAPPPKPPQPAPPQVVH